MKAKVNLQRVSSAASLPKRSLVQRWIEAAVSSCASPFEVTVRLVDAAEGQALNRRFRGVDRATNVLSFPFEPPPGWSSRRLLLGDVVLCVPLVQQEAATQEKSLEAHFAHLVIHGVLHLLGHDHEREDEAYRMEALETAILTGLGYPDPYRSLG